MKDLLILLAVVAVGVAVWKFLSVKLYAKGLATWKVRLSSIPLAIVAAFTVMAVLVPKDEVKKPQELPVTEREKQPADQIVSTPVSVQDVAAEIKKLNRNIKSVSVNPEFIQIDYFKKSIWNGKQWVSGFFIDAKEIMEGINKINGVKDIKSVTFLVQIPTVDQLGKESESLGMKVTYALPQFKEANWSNMTSFNMANLPDDVQFKRLGMESSIEYCKDEDTQKYADQFCRMVLKKLSQ